MTSLSLFTFMHWRRKWQPTSSVLAWRIPWTAAHQAPPSLGFSRQEHGVGCHFLLQCMKVESESEVAQSCPTPSDPMDCSLSGSSIHGIFQARVLEWGAIAFSYFGASELNFHPSSILFSRSVMSNSVLPHRRQPTRVPRPWHSPGKNTGVGCHFLLQGISS